MKIDNDTVVIDAETTKLAGFRLEDTVRAPAVILFVDDRKPELLAETVGLDNALALYRTLLQADSYDRWSGQWDAIRAAVLAMQEHGRHRCAAGD